ncbi:MAG: dienelactone hydrolase family protein [Pseudomonadota bacterium]|nr:dienelactone hydrolase family protein [Pseudomonadota bacterium]MDQ3160314.1 dienelactone hydrolase family protein [Pseudomonadota bacterium]
MSLRIIFLMALLATGRAFASEPVATTVSTQQGVTLKAWYFAAEGSASTHPAVVLLHGCAGVYSYSKPNAKFSNLQQLFLEWGRRLSGAGYAAILIDSYTGRGDAQNQCGNGTAGTDEVVGRAYDALAGFDKVTKTRSYKVDPVRVAVLGWSQGGSTTLSVMDISTWPAVFKLGVAFYPACGLQNAYGGISASTYAPYSPLHVLFGTGDDFYKSGNCQTRQQRSLDLGSLEFKPIWTHADAGHSFDYCTKTSSTCTSIDTYAKSLADPRVMEILAGL